MSKDYSLEKISLRQIILAKLYHDGSRYVFRCSFEERATARDAGFSWDGVQKIWFTRSNEVAARLLTFATPDVTRHHLRVIETFKWCEPLPQPPTGLEFKPHQPEGIRWALTRNCSFLRWDPGLGKTIVAATVAKALGAVTVYVTPPSLAYNVEAEFQKWAPGLRVFVVEPKHPKHGFIWPKFKPDVLVFRDSFLSSPDHFRFAATMGALSLEALIIIDEAHRFKNPSSQRSQALFELTRFFSREVYMSGTPIPNRLIELFPVLDNAAPETIGWRSLFSYGYRYCGGYRNSFGAIEFKGATRVPELVRKLRKKFMLRMTKDILDLPPYSESVVVIDGKLSKKIVAMEWQAKKEYGEETGKLIEQWLAAKYQKGNELHVATYRRLIGLEKVRGVAKHVRLLLEDDTTAVLLFGLHTEVIEKLAYELAMHNPYVITGATPMKERHRQVKAFQSDKGSRLFIGNITAMGEGLTLTKANRVVIAEPDWVPGKNIQAAARAHRLGQARPVHAEYMVYKNSIDKAVVETLLKKRQIISQI